MPSVQKQEANERLEAIDKEIKDIISKQEERLEKLDGLEGDDDETTKQRTTLGAEVRDANTEMKKLKDERFTLEAIVEAAREVEADNRERLKERSPKNPRKTEEEKATESWSWARFIECALEDKWDGAEAELRSEALKEAAEMNRTVSGTPLHSSQLRVMGIDHNGNKVNVNISQKYADKIAKRDQTAGVAGEGGNLIETTLGRLIPALTPRTRVLGMGVQFLPGLQGNLEWPRETNVITGSSVAEKAQAPESSIVFDKISMSPNRIAHHVEFTRDLVHRGKEAINRLVPNRLDRGIGIEWDRQLIVGSGASNEILGALNISGIGDVAIGANGGAPLWTHFLQLEEIIADANADVGEIRALTNPKVRRKAKETEIFSGTSGQPIWSRDNEINSYPVEITTQVPSDLTKGTGINLSAFLQGYWPGMLVGLWGSDIIVNPFSLDREAMVRVSAHLWTDMDVEHPEYFAAIQDIVTA